MSSARAGWLNAVLDGARRHPAAGRHSKQMPCIRQPGRRRDRTLDFTGFQPTSK
jgi:hypothetical protein